MPRARAGAAVVERLAVWHHELGEAWREVQALLFHTGMPQAERAAIERALARIDMVRARIEAVRREMRG
jgi:hypothetical protein